MSRARLSTRSSVLFLAMAVLVATAIPVVAVLAQGTPVIQLLNPSDYRGTDNPVPDTNEREIISFNTTGDGNGPRANTYRISAWVANAPADAVVEFELQGVDGTQTIGTATKLSAEIYVFDWSSPTPLTVDGNYTLRAILYASSSINAPEIARDEHQVTLDRAATSADIVYPTMGGAGGFYVHPLTGATNILVDTEYSASATFVAAYYTTSEAGDDPVWKLCGTTGVNNGPAPPDVAPAGSARVRCNLQSSDQGGGSVTAIAAVANVSPRGPGPGGNQFRSSMNEAGDVVQVAPYEQRAATVSVEPSGSRVNPDSEGAYDCVPDITATIVDSQGRPIAGHSLDAHAQGPSDQLKFRTAGQGTTSSPPDRAHEPLEPGSDSCTDLGGEQGEHNRVGQPDIKHTEKLTGSSGGGAFRLVSDRAGQTQITFFADMDDDDQFCQQEPAVAATIGWGEDPGQPVILPSEETACTVPSPPPPGSPSPSPTGSEASPTGSPPSPTGTGPTPSDDPDPERHNRSIGIRFKHRRGDNMTVRGRVRVDDGYNDCRKQVPVKIQKKSKGKFVSLRQVSTNAKGIYKVRVSDRTGKYRAKAVRRRLGPDRNHICQTAQKAKRHRH